MFTIGWDTTPHRTSPCCRPCWPPMTEYRLCDEGEAAPARRDLTHAGWNGFLVLEDSPFLGSGALIAMLAAEVNVLEVCSSLHLPFVCEPLLWAAIGVLVVPATRMTLFRHAGR